MFGFLLYSIMAKVLSRPTFTKQFRISSGRQRWGLKGRQRSDLKIVLVSYEVTLSLASIRGLFTRENIIKYTTQLLCKIFTYNII